MTRGSSHSVQAVSAQKAQHGSDGGESPAHGKRGRKKILMIDARRSVCGFGFLSFFSVSLLGCKGVLGSGLVIRVSQLLAVSQPTTGVIAVRNGQDHALKQGLMSWQLSVCTCSWPKLALVRPVLVSSQ